MASENWYALANPQDHTERYGRCGDYATALQLAQAIATRQVIGELNRHVVILEMPTEQVVAMLRALDTSAS